MVKYIIFAILLVQFLYFVFYGLFEVTSPTHNYCISDISQFTSGQSSINELSWLVVSLWIVAQAVQLALYCYCIVQGLKMLFNIKGNTLSILIVLIYLFLWSLIGENTIGLEKVFFTHFASIITLVSQYIVPFMLLIGYAVKNRRKNIKQGEKTDEKIKNIIQS